VEAGSTQFATIRSFISIGKKQGWTAQASKKSRKALRKLQIMLDHERGTEKNRRLIF
jgi:hypothetical protein